ncbi:MAG TPA: HEAT repeat domain-containing protein [Terriglobia bacterium]|nr:HEAT repeat domain-containing protein [Terriglobia bacterium]
MHLQATPISAVLLVIAVVIALATAALIAFAFSRRRRREKHFRDLDELHRQCTPIVHNILAGSIDYAAGIEALRRLCPSGSSPALEQTLLFRNLPDAQVPLRRRLCEDLGWVERWQQRLVGQPSHPESRSASTKSGNLLERLTPLRFVGRAESAQNLGLVRHTPSWRVLVNALDDPSLDVRASAATALSLIQAPESVPALVERLQAVALSPSPALSVRQIKAVLVRFPVERSLDLLPSLRHSHPRVRYLATDIIRGMVEREAAADSGFTLAPECFALELAEVFLSQLVADTNPDVRARAAAVVARLSDARAEPALRCLLDDPEWFVRLHAVRSLGDAPRPGLLDSVTQTLTDSNWRVREASSRTLLQWGGPGIRRLLEHFLVTDDAYSREQIAELLERAGLISPLLRQRGEGDDERGSGAMEALIEQGTVGTLLTTIEALDGERQRTLLERLAEGNGSRTQVLAQALAARIEQRAPALLAGLSGRTGNVQKP